MMKGMVILERSIFKCFVKYVSLNVLGMIALSCYILADTFFVSKALGATGLAALNLSISVYSVINGIGLMIGIGGASRYGILKSQNEDKKANIIFTTGIKMGIAFAFVFLIIGIFGSKALALILGADATTLSMTNIYLKTILCFAPFFISNNIVLAFVRNDNNPNLSMLAMLVGSFSNIILDYIFMFPLGMGMFGAAFATGLAPIISLGVLSIHFIKKKNSFHMIRYNLLWENIRCILSVGLSSFINEISSAVVLITFNLVILGLEGNLGVAAYGIVANLALVGVAIFTGIAQGIQPLLSKGYGLRNKELINQVIKYAILTSFSLALVIYLVVFCNVESIIGIFNSENNMEVLQIAKVGFKIYFIGFVFVGINIIMTMYLSVAEYVKEAFIISLARGCVVIVPLVILLSLIWGMVGVWSAFVLTELLISAIAIFLVILPQGESKFVNNMK